MSPYLTCDFHGCRAKWKDWRIAWPKLTFQWSELSPWPDLTLVNALLLSAVIRLDLLQYPSVLFSLWAFEFSFTHLGTLSLTYPNNSSSFLSPGEPPRHALWLNDITFTSAKNSYTLFMLMAMFTKTNFDGVCQSKINFRRDILIIVALCMVYET